MYEQSSLFRRAALTAAFAALAAVPAWAGTLAVDVWTDRGESAVYQPDDPIQIGIRATDDAFILAYEIDSEGYVHVLFPHLNRAPLVTGGQTVNLPEAEDNEQLVVQGPVGQGYVVAIASRSAFKDLPWYLRPYDEQAEELGYQHTEADDQSGVTAEGRIVGDPFVAMERIRRAVLMSPDDADQFSEAYTSYYVHSAVRYPRYLCYDCHRPGQYAFWDGFDPYYTTCSAFTFHVNAAWYWGPTYWFGFVPRYVYVVSDGCPPLYRPHAIRPWYSSWDGWTTWNGLWGGPLHRYRSQPPAGYVGPDKFAAGQPSRDGRALPPGYMASSHGDWARSRAGSAIRRMPVSQNGRMAWRSAAPGQQSGRQGYVPRGEWGSRGMSRPDRTGSANPDRGQRFDPPREMGRAPRGEWGSSPRIIRMGGDQPSEPPATREGGRSMRAPAGYQSSPWRSAPAQGSDGRGGNSGAPMRSSAGATPMPRASFPGGMGAMGGARMGAGGWGGR